MSVALEVAVASDAAAIGAILSAWIDEVDWMVRLHPPREYQGYGELLVAAAPVTVARKSGRLVGFLARQGGDIQALHVVAPLRGQGIGAELLDGAKAECAHLGLWVFQANAGARRFYARHGFIEDRFTDGRGNDEKLPDVHLSWNGDRT